MSVLVQKSLVGKIFNVGYILGDWTIVLALILIQTVLDAIEVISLEFPPRKLPTDFLILIIQTTEIKINWMLVLVYLWIYSHKSMKNFIKLSTFKNLKFSFLNIFLFSIICIFCKCFAYVCMPVHHVYTVSSCRGQRRILDPLELEIQTDVSLHLWVLGIKAGFSTREVRALNHKPCF